MVNTLKTQGIAVPTPIQEQAIPLVMNGKDVIAQSQTGTGKTFAFILPILEKVNANDSHIQALIVTPTRELALQITNEVKKLLEDRLDIRVLAIYGGQDVESQLKKLKSGSHIVIGTPGRLLDHIRRQTVDFSKARFLVLDEADQMLHIGFLPEVEQIINETPSSRQTMLFSATMPDEIRNLARRHLKSPQNIQVEKTQAPLENIKQIAISTSDRAKQGDLMELLHLYRPYLGVIFCRTKRRVTKLYEALKENGFNCDQLHGDLSQAKREQVMKRFRKAEIQFLIATDVAARGLDVEGVTHVFNYDIPEDTESYIHRIGRTGRAGGEGLAVTLYSPKDRDELLSIESDLNVTIPKKNIGNEKKIQAGELGVVENQGDLPLEQAIPKRAKKGKNERNAIRRSMSKGSGPKRESRDNQSRPRTERSQGASQRVESRDDNRRPRTEGFQGSDRREESRDDNRGKRTEGFQGSGPRRESQGDNRKPRTEGFQGSGRRVEPRDDNRGKRTEGFQGSGPRRESRDDNRKPRTEGFQGSGRRVEPRDDNRGKRTEGFQGSGPRRESRDDNRKPRVEGFRGNGAKSESQYNQSRSQSAPNKFAKRGDSATFGRDSRKESSSSDRKPLGQQNRKHNKSASTRPRNK
jgi:ATP-dependent RNA helicase DeaD